MASIFSLKDDVSVAAALVAGYNRLHDAVVQNGASGVSNFAPTGGYFHRDVTSQPGTGINFQNIDYQNPNITVSVPMVVAAMGTGFPGSFAAAVDLQGKLLAHFNDDGAHLCKDVSNATGMASIARPLAASDATGTANLLNQVKLFFNQHLTQLSPSGVYGPGQIQVHVLNDTLNTNSTATATTTGTSFTLAGALASGVSAHFLTGPSVGRIKLIG